MNLKLPELNVCRSKNERFSSGITGTFLKKVSLLLALTSFSIVNAQTGTWSIVTNTAPDLNMGVMLLMTDGTVITHDLTGQNYGTGWDKLTPDASGSYINGSWSQIGSMTNDRLFFASQVLPSGKVFVAGGEYGSGNGPISGEIYNPVTDVWSATGGVVGAQNIYDGNSENLANGNILVGLQNGNNPSFDCQFYNPTSNTWSNAPNSPRNHDEAAWLKLPDASILFVGIDGAGTATCRYIPGTNTWVADATVPVNLYDPYGKEAGAAIMLPNGKAVFFGATGHNAIYTPSGNSSPGTWAAAVDFPKVGGILQTGTIDAPAAMMPNGRILCAASPINSGFGDQFRAPTYFFEYDYTNNTFAMVTSPLPGINADSIPGVNCDFTTFLLLPNGSVLLGVNQQNWSDNYWIYTPAGATIPQGKPVINSIYQTACGNNYFIRGKLFNGISEGAAFGDDWQMSTNYPLVELTDGTNVYFAKTTNWNRIGALQTDSLEDTAQFALPAGLPVGTYSLTVVVNGFSSNPTLFSPFMVTDSALAEESCHGSNIGNAKAYVSGGNLPYTYHWSNGLTSNPTGGTLTVGTYTVTVTDHIGCTVTASITISQPATLATSLNITQVISCMGGNNGIITPANSGGNLPYTYSWSNGATTTSLTGLTTGTYSLTLTDKSGCTATASINLTQPASALSGSSSIVNEVKCHGTSTGKASGSASGGSPPYTYSWSTFPIQGTQTANGLSAGSYTVTITDHTGCSLTSSVTITQAATLLTFSNGNVQSSTASSCDGKEWDVASGGASPYTYLWSPGGATTDTIKNLCDGDYCCKITDHNGCVDSVCQSIATGIPSIGNAPSVKIFPDPNNGYFTISGIAKGQVIEIYNYTGQQVGNYISDDNSMHLDIADKANGVYMVRILYPDGHVVTQAKILKTN